MESVNSLQDAYALKDGPVAAKPTGVALEISMSTSQFQKLNLAKIILDGGNATAMTDWLKVAESTVGAAMWATLKSKYDTNGWALVATMQTSRVMSANDYYFVGIAENASVSVASQQLSVAKITALTTKDAAGNDIIKY